MPTKKDLERIGVYHMGSKMHHHRFQIPNVGEVNLYEPYSYDDSGMK
jgi:hypothetical protein